MSRSNKSRRGASAAASRPERKSAPGKNAEKAADQERPFRTGFFGSVREWADAIIIAFVLAMFIRAFTVELYKIPSGSMTPTLIGGEAVEYDYDGDGRDDLLVYKSQTYQIWLSTDDKTFPWKFFDERRLPEEMYREVMAKTKTRYDRILVNKFAYWFGPPRRGDLVVFKVPERIWDAMKPIYIKRAAGLPGEKITFETAPGESDGPDWGQLTVNGARVNEPPVFQHLRYGWSRPDPEIGEPEENVYSRGRFVSCNVPQEHILALGDNTNHSSDGRYWGTVPLRNLKGRAFFRYLPLRKMKFLK